MKYVDLHTTVRAACAEDQVAITSLVHGEHLNPNDLHWQRFTVATDPGGLVGAVQVRRHPDQARELGSFVVRRELRGLGVGALLVQEALRRESGPVFLVTRAQLAPYFERWRFELVPPRTAPASVRSNHRLGTLLGGLASVFKGRLPSRMVVMALRRD
ncbi:MAG TPA: GNAT family N-acetyltransferase [Ramlibacter sp.]|nr:GNAT family N-acetyltransferase [Ramlibacter sp.]